ncbi:MAG: exodeoxyribonuclease VII large subunit, partial [Propionicimonas sp.]
MALPSSPDAPQPLRVIVNTTKDWVERLGPVWVEGQLIEIKRRAGGVTQFLTLRDQLAEVSVTLSTPTAVLDSAGPLVEGTVVAAWVKPTVWTKSGSLTFECRELRPSGEGRLLAAIEQRKRMLQAEGLFNPVLKRRLPLLPRRIGLITGAGSAAERDVVENIARRWPAAVLEVRHTLVQGAQAVEQIV